jgi:hypothetical protein
VSFQFSKPPRCVQQTVEDPSGIWRYGFAVVAVVAVADCNGGRTGVNALLISAIPSPFLSTQNARKWLRGLRHAGPVPLQHPKQDVFETRYTRNGRSQRVGSREGRAVLTPNALDLAGRTELTSPSPEPEQTCEITGGGGATRGEQKRQ